MLTLAETVERPARPDRDAADGPRERRFRASTISSHCRRQAYDPPLFLFRRADLKHTRRTNIGGAVRHGALAALFCASAGAALAIADGDSGARHVAALPIPAPAVVTPPKPHWGEETAVFAAKLVRGYGLRPQVAAEFAGWILEAAVRQRLQPELVASLVMAESSFRKHVRSVSGASGPAQVRADLWHGFCGGDLSDPEQNVYCGAQILGHYRDMCSRAASMDDAEACALRSYNLGYGNRDNAYFLGAAARYLAKIDRYRAPLREQA